MAAIRLTSGSCGCPPTATPPDDYVNPFRFDSAGCLWLTNEFVGFRYFGAARHDVGTIQTIGSGGVPISTDPDIISGSGVTAGTATSYTVTNDTGSTLALLFGCDLFCDMTTRSSNLVKCVLSARFNGNHHSNTNASSVWHDGTEVAIRSQFTASSNPHDLGIEGTGSPDLTVASGSSAVVSAKLFFQYVVGAPSGTEVINSAASAVRVYAYII